MTTLYLIRHAESTANSQQLLAGQKDFPLTSIGKADAHQIAAEFAAKFNIDAIWCSPLLRAQQTAAPFVSICDIPMRFDKRLMEQDLGRFSGLSYAEAEADPDYCADRKARWDWVPAGNGESYRMIASRVADFLNELRTTCLHNKLKSVLIVTHAVTLRLIRATLEGTLPRYPETIAANGELWIAALPPLGESTAIQSISLSAGTKTHRA